LKIKESWLDAFELVDSLRVFPRVFVGSYMYVAWLTFCWFVELKNPSMAQASFASAVIGLCAPLCNWYMRTGRDWSRRRNARSFDDDGCDPDGGGWPGVAGGGYLPPSRGAPLGGFPGIPGAPGPDSFPGSRPGVR
jgi:hypothetical protein